MLRVLFLLFIITGIKGLDYNQDNEKYNTTVQINRFNFLTKNITIFPPDIKTEISNIQAVVYAGFLVIALMVIFVFFSYLDAKEKYLKIKEWNRGSTVFV